MVGMERKNENSSAAGRDMPANCPPVMVDMERDVPGNTAENSWQRPIQTACPRLIGSTFSVRKPTMLASDTALAAPTEPAGNGRGFPYTASTTHIITPPTMSEVAITCTLSRFFPITLVSKNAGTAVTTKATVVSVSGWLQTLCLRSGP